MINEFELLLKYQEGEVLTDAETSFLAELEIEDFLSGSDREYDRESEVLDNE